MNLRVQIKMAAVIATIKIMPENPEIDLDSLEIKVKQKIEEFTKDIGAEVKASTEPVAFGLVALNIIFVMDESIGSPDVLSESVSEFEEVASAEITDVRRAIG